MVKTKHVLWVSFGDRWCLWLTVLYKTIVFKSHLKDCLLFTKNGFFQKQPNFPCFSDLLKCNCKLISDVGFCLLHFDRSASSFFRRATHGLCQVQLLSWWPESIHRRRGNVLHYNMCLVNSGNAGSVVYTCIQTLNIFNI